MARAELSLFSYEVLGLIGSRGASPHDLKLMVQRGEFLAWAGESQYYTEPKRLARLGYLESSTEPGRTRPRTVYRLTPKGLRALKTWAEAPCAFTPLKSEPLTRLLIADLVGEGATRRSLLHLREEIARLEGRLEEAEKSAAELPHRRKYLLIVTGFLRRTLELHLELVAEVERELAAEGRARRAG